MPQIREQIAMVHLPPSKTLKYLFHVRKTKRKSNFRKKIAFSFCTLHSYLLTFISSQKLSFPNINLQMQSKRRGKSALP